jgi:hypothetical protein
MKWWLKVLGVLRKNLIGAYQPPPGFGVKIPFLPHIAKLSALNHLFVQEIADD